MISGLGIEDIVDMETDVLHVLRTAWVLLPGCRTARDARDVCSPRPRFTACGLRHTPDQEADDKDLNL